MPIFNVMSSKGLTCVYFFICLMIWLVCFGYRYWNLFLGSIQWCNLLYRGLLWRIYFWDV